MAKPVKCPICGQRFDREKEPFVMIGARRYAHEGCANDKENKEAQKIIQSNKDQSELGEYIKTLYPNGTPPHLVWVQIARFVKDNNFTYRGMLNALKYFIEVQGNNMTNSKGVGIIPFCYEEAQKYYTNLEHTQKINEKKLKELSNDYIDIHIQSPKRKIKKRERFTFLKGEENN